MAETRASTPSPIVVALDFDKPSGIALRRAAEIFRRSPACELDFLHVVRDLPGDEAGDRATVVETVERMRDFLRDKLGDPTTIAGRTVGLHVRSGETADEIVRFAADVDAQLIVVGSHGREGIAKKLLGSTSEKVLLLSNIPVVIATGDPSKEAPAIEPACPACHRERRESRGKRWWCAQHSQHHPRARSYSYREQWPSCLHDSEVVPTGLDLR